jgi:hypothetical protein
MIATKCLHVIAAAAVAICGIAAAAAAQITTSTVVGTVKDPQGGVIPGAIVVLISDARGVRVTEATTNAQGDFVFVNVPPDRYTVQITMEGFKNFRRSDIPVSAGDRVAIGTLTIEMGGLAETVQVTSEAALIQASSGERSFTIDTESVSNLPIFNRSFTELASLAPGVETDGSNTPQRIGGGGSPNIMMDGVSTMDTGSNRPLLQMNIESIAEVKVLTSGYQAEYGRSSGVQVTAVTKSGTNRFRGAAYSVFRDSDWNAISRTNALNGDPKPTQKEKDLGYSIGGPIGRPGGHNKLFFFYSQEFAPRTAGNNVVRFRVPTLLEREGDFSQTFDNNGNRYPYVRDPAKSGACNATSQVACFADGGVLGRIPASSLYQPGLDILKLFPLPNITDVPPLQNYNLELRRPVESILSWQPAFRIDYQPASRLRATFKYSAWMQADHLFLGTVPGFNDTKMQDAPVFSYTASANYSLNNTTFIEATYGFSQNELAGCAQAQSGTGAIFCNNRAGSQGVPMTSFASLSGANLQALPFLFPNATVVNQNYYAVRALNSLQPAFWDGTRMAKVPAFSWGNRVPNDQGNCTSTCAPPPLGFPGWFNINNTRDLAISLTKLKGRHTIKTGFYNTHSYKAEQTSNNAFGTINFQQEAVGTNPFDTSYGFANAAIGTFSSYQQAEKYIETNAIYNNTEAYIQDNWKVTPRLTLDYGMRFVHQQAQYDTLRQASNFLPDRWTLAAAPLFYVAGCVNGVYPCPGTNRQAMHPVTGQFLGPNSALAIGTLVPDTGNPTNGLFLPGEGGLPKKAQFNSPFLVFGPRFGMAYDLTGAQRIVLRGGAGLFYDRPSSTTFSAGVNNPPTSRTITVQYGQLQTLGTGLTEGAPTLNAIQVDTKVPSSTQWNAGVQVALPWSTIVDMSYIGQHSYNTFNGVNINMPDFGAAFQPENQDPTLTPSATPGATALQTNQLRPIRGYGAITMQLNRGWRTYHSLQLSFQRRFRNGLSFGFNDTIGLYDRQQSAARLQHNPDGTFFYRADQAEADELLGNNNPVRHTMRGNFVWDLPDLRRDRGAVRALAYVINDWRLSGIWAGATGSPYSVGFNYQSGVGNMNVTGSPDYPARIRIVGDPGKGCSDDVLRQFNATAFQGPASPSFGLESGTNYLKGCFRSALDMSIARNIRLGGGRTVQLRLDVFNVPNAAIVTNRQSTVNFVNPATNTTTITNLPYDPVTGEVIEARSRPRGAGAGVATEYQNPRRVQAQVRVSF